MVRMATNRNKGVFFVRETLLCNSPHTLNDNFSCEGSTMNTNEHPLWLRTNEPCSETVHEKGGVEGVYLVKCAIRIFDFGGFAV